MKANSIEKKKDKANGRASSVVSIILCAIFIPIILMNTTMIIKTYTDPDHLPGVFGIKPAIVLSGSMSPLFEAKALIFVKSVDTAELKQGDVICYLSDGAAVTHRIESINKENGEVFFITRGDANNAADRLPVYPSQVEGLYIGHISGLGGFVMFMQSTTGMLLFIVLPVLLYLGYDIVSRNAEAKKEKRRLQELEEQLASIKSKPQ